MPTHFMRLDKILFINFNTLSFVKMCTKRQNIHFQINGLILCFVVIIDLIINPFLSLIDLIFSDTLPSLGASHSLPYEHFLPQDLQVPIISCLHHISPCPLNPAHPLSPTVLHVDGYALWVSSKLKRKKPSGNVELFSVLIMWSTGKTIYPHMVIIFVPSPRGETTLSSLSR